jgi:hypothetical protein
LLFYIVLFSVCKNMETYDMETYETWRLDMETWKHGEMETKRHGDNKQYCKNRQKVTHL